MCGRKQIQPGQVLPRMACPHPPASQPADRLRAKTASLRLTPAVSAWALPRCPPSLLPETGHPALHRPASCRLHLEDTASAASWAEFRSCRPSTQSSSRLPSPRHQMGVSVHTCVQWGTCTCSSCRAPGTDKETSAVILCSQPNNVASCRQKRGHNTTQHDTAWPTRNGQQTATTARSLKPSAQVMKNILRTATPRVVTQTLPNSMGSPSLLDPTPQMRQA